MKLRENHYLFCWYYLICFKCFLATNNHVNLTKQTTTTTNKYLIYECKFHCGGWADRLKGIMSVYALSLLTNRHFIIDIRTPCNFSKLFMPNKIDWLSNHHANSLFYSKSKFNKRIYTDCLNNFEPICLTKFNYLLDNDQQRIFSIKANQEWLTYFSKSSLFRSQILQLGFNSTNLFRLHLVFRQFYQRLFKLTPPMTEKYARIKRDARITPQTQIFCAQIRIGGARPHVKYDNKINVLGRTQRAFWKFIRENFISKALTNDWRLFVTSDIESIELEAINEFGRDRIIRIEGISTHVDREANLGNDCTRVEKPILDFHFLQNCHKAVISKSGFGRLGLINRHEPMRDVYVFDGSNDFMTLEEELEEQQGSERLIFSKNVRALKNKIHSLLIFLFNLFCICLVILIGIQLGRLVNRRRLLRTKMIAFFVCILVLCLFKVGFFFNFSF